MTTADASARDRLLARMVPIDEAARSGRCLLVMGPRHFAVARWHGERWVYPGSRDPIGFEPQRYQPPGDRR